MRIDDSPEVDSSRLRKFLRSGFHMEQLSGADLSRLIRKILQHETRIAFQNDEVIVAVRSRFEDQGRAGDPDRLQCRGGDAAPARRGLEDPLRVTRQGLDGEGLCRGDG